MSDPETRTTHCGDDENFTEGDETVWENNNGSNDDTLEEECAIVPKEGMKFPDEEALYTFYKQYAYREGFPVRKRNSKKGEDGMVRYVSFVCGREGRKHCIGGNSLKPQPTVNSGCKARITACSEITGRWRVNKVHLEHNHRMSPSKSRLYRCNREISAHIKRKLEVNDIAGIPLHKSFNSAVVEAGGYDHLKFVEKDCRNYVEKVRRLRLGEGDAAALQAYFSRMQANCPGFYFSMDLDEEGRLKNVFWADNKCRQAYKEFGDVVTFDTTYLTNKYDMLFAPFVGVNHHGQSTLLGCGLVSNEETNTFVWLFTTWLQCMHDRAPIGIITDQDRAMQNAIQIVFPNTRHRWCLWHILKKLPEKFGYHMHKASILSAVHEVVYESQYPEEFDQGWNSLIDKYILHDNDWFLGLYKERYRWVPCFLKSSFWAGMSTTQRSESVNAFFDGFVNARTSLKQFVEQYERALKSKVEKEFQADFKSFSQMVPCATKFEIEKQYQEVYTIAKFREFQEELTGVMYCQVVSSEDGCFGTRYLIRENAYFDGGMKKKKTFTILFQRENCQISCSCQLFEFRGILCKYSLLVLINNDVESLPETYILRRWRRDVSRAHTRVPVSGDGWACTPGQLRYDQLCKVFAEVADSVAEDEEKALEVMQWMENRLLTSKSRNKYEINHQPQQITHEASQFGEAGNIASRKIIDPNCSKRKGAPRKNRIKGALERTTKKVKVTSKSKKCKSSIQDMPHQDALNHVLNPVSYSQQLMCVQYQENLSPPFDLNLVPPYGMNQLIMPMQEPCDHPSQEDVNL